ncbi:Putative inner membrane protein (DUF1819) [Halobacteroides halobius DSM 5150]|uniref:Putative inner membrane protein (DUF1819) n=1 Tax=Halobacteroides halobius (strain ATCC 35273 / DSM 5150 / MD-1) TaxID=748449 RepID=L0K922_HALHC|nr:DUF1819 family protein [Halobacteroides halobius]AGB41050.1 Putative inner membrane protein (DUF1819) [Halobacteroides halobius DSM 5150]
MKKYSTRIKSTDFMYIEFKKVARLKLENPNLTSKEIKTRAVEDNIFQVDTVNRRKTIAKAMIRRLKVVDEYLLEQLANGVLDTSKQITLYTILKNDRLFFEFMREVYREKYLIKDPYLTDKDFNIFFHKKSEQSEKVAGWKDYTYYKLKQTIVRILFEAGFINHQDERRIVKPIMNQELIEHLNELGDQEYAKVMLAKIR